MLRRKLMLTLGSLVALLLLAAVCAILLLQDVLQDLDHLSTAASAGCFQANKLASTITAVEVELNDITLNDDAHLDGLIEQVDLLEDQVAELGEFYVTQTDGREAFDRLNELLPTFIRHVGNLATTQDPELSAIHTAQALQTSVAMRNEIAELGNISQVHMRAEQAQVTSKFRWIVLGVVVVFLVAINVAIAMLLRAASMVLRPVDRLVDASRRLAHEEFDHRVQIAQHDEFDELAQAYNHLAEQLQLNEQRKLETLQYVARTLNHELNNAISIIEMQLNVVARSSDDHAAMERPLKEIRDALRRMSGTVHALTRIRRIVLTDYLEGMQMLDLQRSAEEDQGSREPVGSRSLRSDA
jgi:nitrate/nitrite-specific signal transduction histidine kinase